MHDKTLTSINLLTSSYVGALETLRDSLAVQLAQVEAQIASCRAFGDAAVSMPTMGGDIAGTPVVAQPAAKPEGQEYRDPKFLQTWKKDSGGTLQNEAEVKRNAEGRPILSEDDMKRLETAVAGA